MGSRVSADASRRDALDFEQFGLYGFIDILKPSRAEQGAAAEAAEKQR
jgi:hypothetical protein